MRARNRTQRVPLIERRIVPSACPARLAPGRVAAELRARLAAGAVLRPCGRARLAPARLLRAYPPCHRIDLFAGRYYLSAPRENEDIRFFVGYLALPAARADAPLYPRLFYKDVSLVWRSASHYSRSAAENWIGKGDVRLVELEDALLEVSAEETTDLPLELQTAFEGLLTRSALVPYDRKALDLVLRRAPDSRIQAYRDFIEPRQRAQRNPGNRVNGGRPIARFARPGDPGSLRFARGYEPDFARGLLEVATSRSRLYGGRLSRYRIASRNRLIQYLFIAGPRQVWIVPPQATTTELSSYGVRTVDVLAPEELCIPGFEYHFRDGDGPHAPLVSQIPPGFAGPPSLRDPSRADASPWLERLPVIREFRRRFALRAP